MSRPTEINISRFDWENSETLRVTQYLSQGFLRRNTDLLALKKYWQSFTDLPNELRTENVYKFTLQTVYIIYVKMSQWRPTRVNMDVCKRFAYHSIYLSHLGCMGNLLGLNWRLHPSILARWLYVSVRQRQTEAFMVMFVTHSQVAGSRLECSHSLELYNILVAVILSIFSDKNWPRI